jgi:thymidylate kinase
MKTQYIIIEGVDGIGKTTQLNKLKSFLLSRTNSIVHTTKALGGDGNCEFQKSIRNVLLSNKFPHNNPVLEETLFMISDMEGIEQAKQFIVNHYNGVVLKDRGPVSHVVYNLAKHGTDELINSVYPPLLNAEKEMMSKFSGVSLILMPDNIEWVFNRLKSRNSKEGVEIVSRLENEDIQRRVYELMENAHNLKSLEGINIKHIFIKETDTEWDVHKKIIQELFGNVI